MILLVSFNTSKRDVLEVLISSAIISKAFPKSILPPTAPPPETVACIGFCLKAFAIDCAKASANDSSTVTLPPTIGATPPATTGTGEGLAEVPLPSAKSSLFDFTKDMPLSVFTSSICSTSKRPPGMRLKKSKILAGKANSSSSN